jgi:hypothetical protein
MAVEKLMFCCVWNRDGTLGEVKKAALGVDEGGASFVWGKGVGA